MAEKGRHMLSDPRAVPNRAIEYAKFDLVTVLNKLIDKLGMSESLVEKALARMMAVPADRFLRMKRSVSLLISDQQIVQGSYQSPILVQWKKSERQARTLEIALTEFR
jgi:DNA-binding transcriptional regulator YdaS (Cro superfamily)